jgi:hypothetical protein
MVEAALNSTPSAIPDSFAFETSDLHLHFTVPAGLIRHTRYVPRRRRMRFDKPALARRPSNASSTKTTSPASAAGMFLSDHPDLRGGAGGWGTGNLDSYTDTTRLQGRELQ